MKRALLLLAAGFLLAVCPAAAAEAPASEEATPLRRVGTLSFPALRESSGLVKSRKYPGVFWTHNDSGDRARIFAVRGDGSLVAPSGVQGYAGVRIEGASNVDWEDIAADDAGNLLIGDIGNNGSSRKDLAVYIVPEPDPHADVEVRAARRIPIAYPDQGGSRDRDFDAEALFWAHGKAYVLTKHRSDSRTTLYRLDGDDPLQTNILTRLGDFDIGGQVTAADASADGRKVAVLTYNAAWLFETEGSSDEYFRGRASRRPLWAKQAEAIAFDGERLLIGNEQRDLYEVKLEELVPLR